MSPARPRVVVVGHGMVGSRFVEELVARAGDRVRVTVLGAEPYEPYNRVLLSDVVAGRVEVASLTMAGAPVGPVAGGARVDVLRGVVATGVDRARRVVRTDVGETVPYDVLVLATGARAHVPPLPGLAARAPDLPRGVHALRTLDDAREIVAAAANRPRALVLGGGVLGVEVACGLARRGLGVTVLHAGPHLMDRQLDAPAAAALAAGLAGLGVAVRAGVRVRDVVADGGVLGGVVLEGGERVPARLLVMTAGTVPDAGLAAGAGLALGPGVVVDERLATRDPAVFAIGDCASPPGGATGLVAQGWAQARRLAADLAARARGEPAPVADGGVGVGGDPPAGRRGEGGDLAPEPPVDVVRVKAAGLAVVAMGRRPTEAPPGARCVGLTDRAGPRHVEVVVHEGRVVGAACVGDGAVAADLVAAYTRRTPAPRDPAHLLLRPVRGTDVAAEPSPTRMPDRTTVCRCNGVTKGDVVAQWRAGARTVAEVVGATRATTGCGGCADAVCGLVEWLQRADPDPVGPDAVGGAIGGRAEEHGAGLAPVRP